MVGFSWEEGVKAIVMMTMIITSMLFPCSSASTYQVGGESGWALESNLQDWAASKAFTVGDILVFAYKPSYNVLEVHHLEYRDCIVEHPILTHNGRHTVIELTQPGPRYFICGTGYHCKMGLKVQIQVLPLLSDNDIINVTPTPTTISLSSSSATSPPSDAISAPPCNEAGEVRTSLQFGYVAVIIVLVMLVS